MAGNEVTNSGRSGVAADHAGTDYAQQDSEAAMGDIKKTAAMQMKQQTEMGILQMMVKLNEALAKMFKALGDAIKGLV
jgi:hypothetical protein